MSNRQENTKVTPTIGILGLEAGHEESFPQLESILGNIAHPQTFKFPVLYKRVKGVYYSTLVANPDRQALDALVEAAQELERSGVKAIATACGFSSIFQRELANAVDIPIFASTLVMIPMVHQMLKADQKVGVITFYSEKLTEKHFQNSGVTKDIGVCKIGLEGNSEWSKIFCNPDATLEPERFGTEVVEAAKTLLAKYPEVGAIVLECGDMPPFAAEIRRAVGLPVFDLVTLVNMAYEVVAADRWGEN
ncbi:MAG: aspartate/glutamate racemase family protein [Calothrix sp. MO_167.B12]|nr:aspartate/glutamate racemase family protein [Calothrix sp. MO_167.B12]